MTLFDTAKAATTPPARVTGWSDDAIGRQHILPGWACVTEIWRHGDDHESRDHVGPLFFEDEHWIVLEIEGEMRRFSKNQCVVTTYEDIKHEEPSA